VCFQGVGYLLMMGVANLCYSLGQVSERLIRPKNAERYRRIVYRLGFWFSVSLPFMVPLLLIILILFFPSWWHLGATTSSAPSSYHPASR
jgi:hypothetical protein